MESDSGGDGHCVDVDGRPEDRDGGADPRQDGVVVAQRLRPEAEIRLARLEVDRKPQRVENLDLVPAILGRFSQPRRAVALGVTGENRDDHKTA